jgi:membrane associated rhomboid family serine protease
MVGFVVLLWVIQAANWADGYRLDGPLAIQPHSLTHLPAILTAPFLHVSWQHIEGNSIPLFVLGFLAAYRGVTKFFAVTTVAIVTSGLTVWLFQSGHSLTVGASGLVFGYFGYVLTRGFFDRDWVDVVVGAVAGGMYYYILVVAVPGTPGVSWLDHSGGLVGGILAGWLLRARPGTAWHWRPVVSSHDQAYRGFPLEARGHRGAEAAGRDRTVPDALAGADPTGV